MAKGDVKPIASNYRGGGWSRNSRADSVYDDEGRGESKQVWEWFERNFEDQPNDDAKRIWLQGQTDARYYWMLKASTFRFNLMDIAYHASADGDSRARRLVIKRLDKQAWDDFHKTLVDAYNRENDRIVKERHDEAERQRGEWAAYEAQREAQRVQLMRDEYDNVQTHVEMTAGMLSSELNQAMAEVERVGDEGEWIDDVVDAYGGHGGFGYNDSKPKGVKVQITLSLDLSNSMIYNSVAEVAAAAFRDIGMTLIQLKEQHGDDLYIGLFTFSQDGYRDGAGKQVYNLRPVRTDKNLFGPFDSYRPSKLAVSWEVNHLFSGTDTWISPLLAAMELWENESSDPGAVRLDLVLTDAVLEHPKDIRDSDTIQERRNGQLQTVFLNFMPENDWLMSTMPKRCYQMRVEKDNVQGILRTVIAEFISVNL